MIRPTDMTDQIVALLPRLRRFGLTLARRPEDADDLVQTTVEKALSRLDTWKEGTRLDSWLFKIMQNVWIDQVRARKVRGPSVGDEVLETEAGSDGRAVLEARLALKDTMRAVMALPEEQRAVIMLVVVEGYSYREAADVLDTPIGTVMSRLARARAALEADAMGSGRETRQ